MSVVFAAYARARAPAVPDRWLFRLCGYRRQRAHEGVSRNLYGNASGALVSLEL